MVSPAPGCPQQWLFSTLLGVLGSEFQALLSYLRSAGPLLLALRLSFLFITHRRSRKLYTGLALALTLSMVVSPFLQSLKAAAFMDQQAAQGAAQHALQQESKMQLDLRPFAADPDWNPNANPLATSQRLSG